MNAEGKKPTVYGTMGAILAHINSQQEQKNLSGNLAVIRNSIGKKYEDTAGVWPILFPLIPEEFMGNGKLNYEEKALLVALQLYAIGQQGSKKILNDKNSSIGNSLRQIRGNESTSLDRRFNTMLTSTTFDEFTYHLRQLFMIGKSESGFTVNYSSLAEDLFWYQNGRSKQICLKWARDYYKPFYKEDSSESNSEALA